MTSDVPIETSLELDSSQVQELARYAVRDVLINTPSYRELSVEDRKMLAGQMVSICETAIGLMQQEQQSEKQLLSTQTSVYEDDNPSFSGEVLAVAQEESSEFSGAAARRVADTTRQILNAVSFPRFVTELINGVFKAITDSNVQQMNAFVELIGNVASTLDGFAETNMSPQGAREWLVERFPGSFELTGSQNKALDEFEEADDEASDEQVQIRLRPSGQYPSDEALRSALVLEPEDAIPKGEPESFLVPLVQRQLARNRQQMLATMVQMGLQRIVIDSGRLNASMQFHIDTRSVAAEDRGERFDFNHSSSVAGSFGVGPWGASAAMTNTIGYVSTSQVQTTEELNTELDLNSSVELNFHTDYLPLNRLASNNQQQRIQGNTINPTEEERIKARNKLQIQRSKDDQKRREKLQESLKPNSSSKTRASAGTKKKTNTQNPTQENKTNSSKQPNSNKTSQKTNTNKEKAPKNTSQKGGAASKPSGATNQANKKQASGSPQTTPSSSQKNKASGAIKGNSSPSSSGKS